jgi:hypothetical protein
VGSPNNEAEKRHPSGLAGDQRHDSKANDNQADWGTDCVSEAQHSNMRSN